MRVDDYKFMDIVDAMACVNQRVNLIGVVVETGVPKRSKGTDYFCSVKIIDESRASGIHINFFAASMERLPQVENVGDILLVSHVVVKTRPSEPYALFNKTFSHFALFEGGDSSIEELVPYQTSSRYKPRDDDKKFIMKLKKWYIPQNTNVLNETLFLREIKEAENLKLFCKILHISNVKDNEPMLFVWDGTDTPPAPLEAKLEDEMESPLPLQFEPSLSRDILCTFPTVGTILRMSVNQGNEKLGLQCFRPNKWVKLTNVKCEVRSALWIATLMPFSKISYMRDDDDAVTSRLRSYNERYASKWGRMPFTSFPWSSDITGTSHSDVPFVTLMDILTYPEVMYKYRCVVRVVATIPCRAVDFRSPSGVYRVRLTLEDPTARIHAFLYAEDGVNFFGNDHSVDVLTKKRNKLLGVSNDDGMQSVENVTRNPPWIQCCLFSYYINESDVWGSRNYRITDTTCLG
ncbi:hypothetical protein ACS0TY_012066 [Phlomoides rotata]